MKALVGAFNQEKALVGAFSVIVQPVVEPMIVLQHYQGRQARELPDRRPGGRGGQHGVHGGLRAGGTLPRHRGPSCGLLQRGADPGHCQVRGAVYKVYIYILNI